MIASQILVWYWGSERFGLRLAKWYWKLCWDTDWFTPGREKPGLPGPLCSKYMSQQTCLSLTTSSTSTHKGTEQCKIQDRHRVNYDCYTIPTSKGVQHLKWYVRVIAYSGTICFWSITYRALKQLARCSPFARRLWKQPEGQNLLWSMRIERLIPGQDITKTLFLVKRKSRILPLDYHHVGHAMYKPLCAFWAKNARQIGKASSSDERNPTSKRISIVNEMTLFFAYVVTW